MSRVNILVPSILGISAEIHSHGASFSHMPNSEPMIMPREMECFDWLKPSRAHFGTWSRSIFSQST